MAYKSVTTTVHFSKDDDEIDLDDDNNLEASKIEEPSDISNPIGNSTTSVERDTEVVPSEQGYVADEASKVEERPISKSDAMKLRMRQLKQKMNQARQLNQQAVREEVELSIMGNGPSGTSKQSTKKAGSNTHGNNVNSTALRLAQENTDIDPKLLLQPAYENLSKQKNKQEKDELNQFAVNDYHNPEGQYRNYQRNIKSLPHHAGPLGTAQQATDGVYDPTDMLTTTADDLKKQRDGAHRVSQELQRRYEKRQIKDRKRKQQEIRQELNDTSGGASVAASGINLRNQQFNQKVARTYDKTTSEIRHNLERGTAL